MINEYIYVCLHNLRLRTPLIILASQLFIVHVRYTFKMSTYADLSQTLCGLIINTSSHMCVYTRHIRIYYLLYIKYILMVYVCYLYVHMVKVCKRIIYFQNFSLIDLESMSTTMPKNWINFQWKSRYTFGAVYPSYIYI